MRLRAVLYLLLMCISMPIAAQPCTTTVPLINSKEALRTSIRQDPRKKLVDLKKAISNITLDLRYGTTNNFTHTILYRHPMALLRAAPAQALSEVQAELNKKGLGLKIYDAYRPFSVTCTLWRMVSDRRYAANPRKGSHHNRAIAVDLTIIDLRTGKELDMGTGFDNFTDSAHHDFAQLPPAVLANRRLLKYVLWKHGFNFVPTEWWHYHWRDKNYDVIDLDHDAVKEAAGL